MVRFVTAVSILLVSALPAVGSDHPAADLAALSSHPRLSANTLQWVDGAEPSSASLEQAAFLVGSWTGEAFGGEVEEMWMPARSGAMLGMFRLEDGDLPSFFELFTLRQEAGSLILRLKHFDAETLHGWESRDETADFLLVALDEDALYFAGLTYRRVGQDELEVYLAFNGGAREEVFRFRRAD